MFFSKNFCSVLCNFDLTSAAVACRPSSISSNFRKAFSFNLDGSGRKAVEPKAEIGGRYSFEAFSGDATAFASWSASSSALSSVSLNSAYPAGVSNKTSIANAETKKI
jgi:hypothetical protein